jgi:hypothetical protein
MGELYTLMLAKYYFEPPPPTHISPTWSYLEYSGQNKQIARNTEEKYTLIHLPQNLQKQNAIYTHPNYPLI